ncbi:CBS domain containing protein [uncultured Desulfobacterium sp.]|uniref:CBS domain containing protein n=1 Tax=uncultured Desulfobacterium sp. TaxID=201089 RepID=A0A445MY90_9BACT|nr:CBS domain containing protein [uncultured Desulfobacterium sp.]
MSEPKVRDLMIPLSEYVTVNEDASLFDAVATLRQKSQTFDQDKENPRAILVLDKAGAVIGKLSQWDVIRGLEPKYSEIGHIQGTSQLAFTSDFIRSQVKKYGLWEHPLGDLCKKAARIKVKDIMYKPGQGECVAEGASMDEAVHQMIVGHHQSLLALRGKEIVGILRLSDVFRVVCDMIMACPA